jgi:superfamily II DNA or RNA helicase/HKD family nuclease
MDLNDGLYDSVITEDVFAQLAGVEHNKVEVAPEELDEYLAKHLEVHVNNALGQLTEPGEKIKFINKLIESFSADSSPVATEEILKSVLTRLDSDRSQISSPPEIPLSQLSLLTNAKGDPTIGSELPKELMSADSVDILMAFVRQTGLNILFEALKKLKNRGVPVRLITSVYIGATEKKALDQLVQELGVEVKVDYLARANRLHAKAWMINRKTGYSTAFVGSSNISDPALISGLEWNVRLSEVRSAVVLDKMAATFESYWNSPDFESYDPDVDAEKLEEALVRARGTSDVTKSLTIGNLDVRPLPHQAQMLSELESEREYHGIHRNLVVAATGSGKTVLAALDFKRFLETSEGKSLLFVAHRKELLEQAQWTFAQVLKDPTFGELLVDGKKPTSWHHVFASVQSFNADLISKLDARKFDYIVIDEFHHAAAPSYKKIISHFEPMELLGLTATPERTDGERVQDTYFGGRIATELRLWDALDQELLAPFHYFGISEETKYTDIEWKGRRGYDVAELSNVVTGNHVRDKLLLDELNRKIADYDALKALVFCVDIKHAKYINELLNSKGLTSVVVTSETPGHLRDKAIQDLKQGIIKALVSVDIFNEGVDIPAVNTVVMLRPTESPLIFLQQLGRGLRKFHGKSSVLVLDFIGAHRAEYRLDLKMSVLTGRSRGELKTDVEQGFPFLPSGVVVSLDQISRERVLASIQSQVAPTKQRLIGEAKGLGAPSLRAFLEEGAREPWEIYRHNWYSWTQLKFEAGLLATEPKSPNLKRISKFLHVNDPERFDAYRRFLSAELEPWIFVSERERRLRNMFFWHMWPEAITDHGDRWVSVDEAIASLRQDADFSSELLELLDYLDDSSRNFVYATDFKNADIPLSTHANYSRYEIMGATGKAYLEGCGFGYEPIGKAPISISASTEGVAYIPEVGLDVFYVTLRKGASFSATTRYIDYAETQDVFHWESQNRTSVSSPTGQRYIFQSESKHDVLLCVRESADANVGTQTFRIAGLADYLRHKGSNPIQLWWKLRVPLDLQTYKVASAIRVA